VTRAPRRFASLLRWDLVLQVRQGFLLAGAVVAATWILLAARWVDPGFASWAPAFALGNLSITSFYFVAGLVLFERGEGSLQAVWLTPVRPAEYLASKVVSLALFAVVETGVILAACFGLALSWVPLCLGMLAMSAIYTLIGVLAVLRYEGISEFILPSALLLTILELPALETVGLWKSALLWLLPLRPPLLVLEWAVAHERVGAGALAFGVLGSLFWIALLGAGCRRALRRFVAGAPVRFAPAATATAGGGR
jgi:fluoroquinolone transport system permease protein